jgi:AcrR family transcriptional regulator
MTKKTVAAAIKPKQKKSDTTRAHILATALKMFRSGGFDDTTMRDIAAEAGVALGGAYYYFPSKEAIVVAYYEQVQEHHAELVRERLTGKQNLRERLGIAMHAKLDILKDDHKLISALFRYNGDPQHSLSFLGPKTAYLRRASVELFDEVIGNESMPDDIREMLPTLLWAMHMGVMLYTVYDTSAGQSKTRKLIDGSLDLGMKLLAAAKFPLLRPFRGQLATLMKSSGLMLGA